MAYKFLSDLDLDNNDILNSNISGGGGGGSSRVLIEEQVLSTTATSVSFSSIPQDYTHLELECIAGTDRVNTQDFLVIAINGDTTASNYNAQQLIVNNGVVSGALSDRVIGTVAAVNSDEPNKIKYTSITLFEYTRTDIYKAFRGLLNFNASGGGANRLTTDSQGLWYDVSAITSIDLTPNTGPNFIAGSEFRLYGITDGASGGSGGGSGGPAEFVRVSRSTNQTISDTTSTDIIFDTEEVDTGGWFDIGSPTDITVTEDGIYNVSACAQWEDNVSGYIQFAIRVNGTSILVDRRNTVDTVNRGSFQAISGSLNLTAGDVITFNVFQETGGNLDIEAAGGRPIFTMAKLEAGGGSGSGGGRELLTANRTYYVATTGSDSNDGLTVGTPFLTVQKAIDVAAALDASIYDVTIQLANGTYNTSTANICKSMVGAGKITVLGDAVTPSNVVLDITAPDISAFNLTLVTTLYEFNGLTFDVNTATPGSSVSGAVICNNSSVEALNCIVQGTDTVSKPVQWFRAEDNGNIRITGNMEIVQWLATGGPSQYVFLATVGGGVIRCQNNTITLTNTPDWTSSGGIVANKGGIIFYNGNTFVGTATNVRFLVRQIGYIESGGIINSLPGSINGTEDTATSGHIS